MGLLIVCGLNKRAIILQQSNKRYHARTFRKLKFIETTLHLITGGPSSRLEKKPTINSWTRHALCDSVLSYERNRWKFEHVIRNAILSMFNDLRSLHSGTCLNTKTPRAFRWKRAFCTWISKFASFWLCFEQADWTQPRKKLGYEVNFLSTASGTVEQCTILAPSPQRHQACFFDLTDFSTVFLGFYGVNFLSFGGNRINIYGVSTDKARRKYVHNFRGNSQFSFLTRITLMYE